MGLTVRSSAYARIEEMISAEECVVLDGGVATELQRLGSGAPLDLELWGTWALYRAPQAVLDVHRRYAVIGCHVLWPILTSLWMALLASMTR